MNRDAERDIEAAVSEAKGIAFDGCHKIYILLDDEQMRLMKDYGYDKDGSSLIYAKDTTPAKMAAQVIEWFEESCSLRFVNSVRTVQGDANDGFENIIEQGWEDPDDIEECRGCSCTSSNCYIDLNGECECCAEQDEDEDDE